jgi:hypothetical protein
VRLLQCLRYNARVRRVIEPGDKSN